ncbi:unnamed protein product [Ceratitis capitata]|uniref:(Mediterranean fruit fly) hypothetical protein n=1 Tax=Ceratitis capitata TaxID=7213 RepID=A0A811V560_CERCA|nr:unnamed protein product [Ceratitis capitata]
MEGESVESLSNAFVLRQDPVSYENLFNFFNSATRDSDFFLKPYQNYSVKHGKEKHLKQKREAYIWALYLLRKAIAMDLIFHTQ